MESREPARLFYCYAHEDVEHLYLLLAQLSVLKDRQGLISEFYDGKIDVGKPWDAEIKQHLRAADIVILLISPYFFNSRYIQQVELQQAIARNSEGNCTLIPVVVEPSLFDQADQLSSLQMLPLTKKRRVKPVSLWHNPHSAWLQVAEAVRAAIRSSSDPSSRSGSPGGTPLTDPGGKESDSSAGPAGQAFDVPAPTDEPPFNPPQDKSVLPLSKDFVGRKHVLDQILATLTHATRPQIIAVTGMPGIGKTAVLAQALHQIDLSAQFPGGTAVVSCRHLADAVVIVQRILARFDPDRRVPESSDWDTLTIFAQQTLGKERCLIVLDDVEVGVNLAPILRCLRAAGAFVLLAASNHQVSTLADEVYGLAPLPLDEAIHLLALSLDTPENVPEGFADAAKRVVEALAYHPLAIRLAGRLAAAVSISVEVLADRVENGPLQIPIEGDTTSLDDYFRTRIEELPESTRRYCIALAAFAGPDIGEKACIAAGKAIGHVDPARDLEALRGRAFLEPVSMNVQSPQADSQRVRLHPLIASAARRLYADLADDVRSAIEQGIASYYIDYISSVSHRALTADLRNIDGALAHARHWHRDDLVVGLCAAMSSFWLDRWMTDEGGRYLALGMKSAARLTDAPTTIQPQIATVEIAYGRTLRRQGDLLEAEAVFKSNLERRRALGDVRGEVKVLDQLAQVARAKGQMSIAKQYCEDGLGICSSISDNRLEAILLAQLGRIERAQGNLTTAEGYFDKSLGIFRGKRDVQNIGVVLGYLGRIARTRGRLREADRHFKASYAIAQDLQDRRGQAVVLSQRGRIARTRGWLTEAHDLFSKSLEIAREVWDRQAEGVDLGYLGRIKRLQGKLDEADEYFWASLHIAQEIQDRQNKAVALGYLGRTARSRGDILKSDDFFAQSLNIATNEIHDRRSEGIILDQVGQNTALKGDLAKAKEQLEQALDHLRDAEDRRGQALVQLHLGEVRMKLSPPQPAPWIAETLFMAALAIAEEMEDWRTSGVALRWLGMVAERRGDVDQAERYFKRSVTNTERGKNILDLVDSKIELARFLAERRAKHPEDCSEIADARRLLRTCTGLPDTAPSRTCLHAIAQQIGCQ